MKKIKWKNVLIFILAIITGIPVLKDCITIMTSIKCFTMFGLLKFTILFMINSLCWIYLGEEWEKLSDEY